MLEEGYWYGLPPVLISGGLLGFWLRERSPFFLVFAIFFLVLAFLTPLLAPIFARTIHLQIVPLVLSALLAMAWRRLRPAARLTPS